MISYYHENSDQGFIYDFFLGVGRGFGMQMHAKGAHACWCTWYLGFTDFNEILDIFKNKNSIIMLNTVRKGELWLGGGREFLYVNPLYETLLINYYCMNGLIRIIYLIFLSPHGIYSRFLVFWVFTWVIC